MNIKQENINKLMDGLSEKEVNKLSEILATMQKIQNGEQDKILSKDELLKTSDTIKKEFPNQPKNFLFKFIISRTKRKINNLQNEIKDYKIRISKQQRKAQKFKNKIKKINYKIEKFKEANNFLENLQGSSEIKLFLIEQNNISKELLKEQIKTLENKIALVYDKAENHQNKVDFANDKITMLNDKISKINEVAKLPNATIMLFLANKLNFKNAEENINETTNKINKIAESPEIFFSEEELSSLNKDENLLKLLNSIENVENNAVIAENSKQNNNFTAQPLPLDFETKNQKELSSNFEKGEAELTPPPDYENEVADLTPPPVFEKGEADLTPPPVFEKGEADLTPPSVEDTMSNTSKNINHTPIKKLNSITLSKEKFEELKPKLSELKSNNITIKALQDNKNSDNIKLIFDKKDSAIIKATVGGSKNTQVSSIL